MPRIITAYSNPLVKYARDLRDKRHRRESGQFLAEGLRILTEAREAGRLPRTIFFAAARHRLVVALVAAVAGGGGRGDRDDSGYPRQAFGQGQSASGCRDLRRAPDAA